MTMDLHLLSIIVRKYYMSDQMNCKIESSLTLIESKV